MNIKDLKDILSEYPEDYYVCIEIDDDVGQSSCVYDIRPAYYNPSKGGFYDKAHYKGRPNFFKTTNSIIIKME